MERKDQKDEGDTCRKMREGGGRTCPIFECGNGSDRKTLGAAKIQSEDYVYPPPAPSPVTHNVCLACVPCYMWDSCPADTARVDWIGCVSPLSCGARRLRAAICPSPLSLFHSFFHPTPNPHRTMAVRVTRGTSVLSELRGRLRYPGSAPFRQEGEEQQQQQQQQQVEEEDAEAEEQRTVAALDSDSDATLTTDPLSELEEFFPAGEEDDDSEDEVEEEEVEGHDGGTNHQQGLYLPTLIEDEQGEEEMEARSPSSLLSLVEKRFHRDQASAAVSRGAPTGAGSSPSIPPTPDAFQPSSSLSLPPSSSFSSSSSNKTSPFFQLIERRQSSSDSTILGLNSPFSSSLRTPASAATDGGGGGGGQEE